MPSPDPRSVHVDQPPDDALVALGEDDVPKEERSDCSAHRDMRCLRGPPELSFPRSDLRSGFQQTARGRRLSVYRGDNFSRSDKMILLDFLGPPHEEFPDDPARQIQSTGHHRLGRLRDRSQRV